MIRKITIIILIVVTVSLVGWDIYAVIQPGGTDNSISKVILDYSRFPVIPFAFGFLMGHFFA